MTKKLNLPLLALAALPALSAAHYLFPSFILNDTVTKEFEYVREHDNGFQPSWDDGAILASNDLRCNKGSENHMSEPQTAKVVAGVDTVGFQTNLATKIYHPGPVTIHMSKAPGDVREYDGSGDWFKVYQLGTKDPWDGTDQGWLTRDRSQFTLMLPKEIPKGQYLMRIEQMAVHPPYKAKQFFMQCAHVEVDSQYTGPAPSDTTKLPGGYSKDDPAIQLDSWAHPKYAPMPKPDKMWPNENNFNKLL
ncbi:glycosyl hydrolase family 61-domain-containing protein [Apiospora aurea]|uniref:lytic cellulose monooxygenase (C4-dehydrogenating) n=1 Tax=Apiospora aurea TaxID=335848 RepID=A0ABR1PXW5_9PEZI